MSDENNHYRMKKRILAVVIAYYPDMSMLTKNMKAFVEQVDKVIVWDNTPGGDSDLACQSLPGGEKTERMSEDGKNMGISYVLNRIWHYAAEHGYDYLLTMDQDSLLSNFALYVEETVRATDAPQGIYCPQVGRKTKGNELYQRVDYGITSGTLVSIDILNRLGGYREDFFVDGIDIELCLRAKRNGIGTYMVTNCQLEQRFGNPKTTRILGHDNHTLNYSPRRLEEIVKTHLILLRDYPCSFSLRKKMIMTYFWKLPQKVLFLEEDKWNKFKAMGRGIREGWRCSGK